MSDHWKCVARGWSRLCRRVTVRGRRHSVGFRARGRDPEQVRSVHLSGGTPDRAVPPQHPCPAGATHRAPSTPEPRRVQRKRPLHQPTPPSTDDGRCALGAPTTAGKASTGPPPRAAATGMSEPRFPSGTQRPRWRLSSAGTRLRTRTRRTPVPRRHRTGRGLRQWRLRGARRHRRGRTGLRLRPRAVPLARLHPPRPGRRRATLRAPEAQLNFPRRTRSSSAWRFRASPSPRIKGS